MHDVQTYILILKINWSLIEPNLIKESALVAVRK